ncbi:MAG TPA: hypothetical protein VLB46_04550 [Pyrinomonadaceae bacterium]|nr:hypothetical protein [Pyrinomonadaceae bacterium]
MKRFAMALALMCVLSSPIFAGNMPTGGKAEEPPPPTTSSTTSTSSTVLVSVILTLITLR